MAIINVEFVEVWLYCVKPGRQPLLIPFLHCWLADWLHACFFQPSFGVDLDRIEQVGLRALPKRPTVAAPVVLGLEPPTQDLNNRVSTNPYLPRKMSDLLVYVTKQPEVK